MKHLIYDPLTDSETIIDDGQPESDIMPEPTTREPTLEERIKALEDAILAML